MKRIPTITMNHIDGDAYETRNPILQGEENDGEFWTENGNVARTFSGQYTIAEVEALLRDMRVVQANLDAKAAYSISFHHRDTQPWSVWQFRAVVQKFNSQAEAEAFVAARS